MKLNHNAIIEMAKEHYDPAAIADATGYSLATVYKIAAKARREGAPILERGRGGIKRKNSGRRMTVTVSAPTAAALKAEAKARGTSPGALVRLIIENAADDSLWSALLDE